MMLLIFLIWLIVSWWPAKNLLAKFLSLDKKITAVLALFLPIFIIGPMANIFTAWFKLNDLTIYLSFILSLIVLFLTDRILLKDEAILATSQPETNDQDKLSWFNWLYVVFGLAFLLVFYNIFQAASGRYLTSPWELLSIWQLVAIAIMAAIIIYGIYCRKIPTVVLLTLIVVFSCSIHSYLLVYDNGFGGDRFRHLGSEERIIKGLEYQPNLLSSNIWYKNLGPIKYPQALTDSAKLSYGTMWSLEVIASKVSGWSVFQVNRFLLPILWSIFLTLIIFSLGYLISPNKKIPLWSALLANGLYLLQYYGSQGLPASYGLLWLVFYLLFLVSYLKNPSRAKLWWLLGGLILMYFNYSLAFILAAIGFSLTLALAHKKNLIYLLSPLAIISLVFLDYLSSPIINFSWSKVLASWSSANLINFNSLTRLELIIGQWHRIDFILMFGLVMIIGVSFWKIWRSRDTNWLLLMLLTKITLAAYFVSYWFLEGEHSLARRLTLFSAMFLVLILAKFIDSVISGNRSLVVVGLVTIIILSLSYYSGPVLNVNVSDREIEKAKAIWHDIKGKPNYCIEDDLGVILALEYVSAKDFQETINNQNCNK